MTGVGKWIGLVLLTGVLFFGYRWMSRGETVDFNTQIKPLLNKHCIGCHGGVKKSGGVSFLFEEEAKSTSTAGKRIIAPGSPGKSEVIARITHADPDKRMPLDGAPLQAEEIELLTRWIRQGAKWGTHWAYIFPEKSEPPKVEKALGSTDGIANSWIKNDVDKFILDKLIQAGLQPAPQADCATLIRRLSLDLTGLPPTENMVADYCKDPSEERYLALVDTLLHSPRYGEHWTAMWLDLARYADSRGFEKDSHREIWKYRDWVIKAFNDDMPYDQFTIEQLAGDLLPDPTPEQYTATAFHRNTTNNDEGGTDNEEYRVQSILDRVNTTWAVWQATTMNCVQCHSHPYDPIVMEDFYKSYDFFNQTRDEDTFTEAPIYRWFPDTVQTDIQAIKDFIKQSKPDKERYYHDLLHFSEPKVHPHHFDFVKNSAHEDTKILAVYNDGYAVLKGFDPGNHNQLMLHLQGMDPGLLEIKSGNLDGPVMAQLESDKRIPWGHISIPVNAHPGKTDLYFTYKGKDEKSRKAGINWFVFYDQLTDDPLINEKFHRTLNSRSQSVPVMLDGQGQFHRETKVFERGNWLVHGATVTGGVPGSFPPLEVEAPNRLDFAKWLVSKENPLTARVMVNRLWEQLFGMGIVETSEDFGTQGSTPSHPELLDWLAVRFQADFSWSVKNILREMVSSAAYRQAAVADALKIEKDPYNRLLSRGPRVRLSAEAIRDQALAVSSLLSDSLFGASVMPYQPEGIWKVVYSGDQWRLSEGKNRYRRAVYTYWRRTSPYPSLIAFDSPSREFCVIRRIRTNTPLQALVTMNDPVYFEAAQVLAKEMVKFEDPEKAVDWAYQKLLFKPIDQSKITVLTKLYRETLEQIAQDPEALRQLESHPYVEEQALNDSPTAAYAVVANAMMNLDEFLTKE